MDRFLLMVVLLVSAQHKADMTNVVPFVSRAHAGSAAEPAVAARATASVVADLVDVVAEIREISGRVLPLPNSASEIERTLQALLDAISTIEHATEVLSHHGERKPFYCRARSGLREVRSSSGSIRLLTSHRKSAGRNTTLRLLAGIAMTLRNARP
jgi:hypothetical protein